MPSQVGPVRPCPFVWSLERILLTLSGMFAASGHGVLRPRDLIFGDDLRQEETQRQIFDTIDKEKPQLVWFAPPCTDWRGFSRLNYTKQELRRRRQKHKLFLKMMCKVLMKPITLLATNPIYQEELQRRCDDQHEHRVIQCNKSFCCVSPRIC